MLFRFIRPGRPSQYDTIFLMRSKPLVLMVDDEAVFLEIASVKLHEAGCETVIAHNSHEALEKAEAMAPDLVLSDIYMPPGPSGWELAFELRHNPKTRNIKFAFFTSLRDPLAELPRKYIEDVAQLGSVSIFSKTDDVDQFAKKAVAMIKKDSF